MEYSKWFYEHEDWESYKDKRYDEAFKHDPYRANLLLLLHELRYGITEQVSEDIAEAMYNVMEVRFGNPCGYAFNEEWTLR